MLERRADGSAGALVAPVGEGRDGVAGQRIDQAVFPVGGPLLR